jgi:putative sterol carrier protein
MTDSRATFFDALSFAPKDPRLGAATGKLRFDVADGDRSEHWLLEITDGRVNVSRGDGRADSVVRTPAKLLDDIVGGRANAMTAFIRGEAEIEGDASLLVRFQRLFPTAPPRAAGSDRSAVRTRS